MADASRHADFFTQAELRAVNLGPSSGDYTQAILLLTREQCDIPTVMEQYVIVSGAAHLATWTLGAGDPVVFLHAGVADSRMWDHQIAVVADTHLALAYDRRGFGQTHPVDEVYSNTDDLQSVLDALAPGRAAVLVGSSQGGRIAIDMALSRPESVKGLVLIAPAVSGAPAFMLPLQVADVVAELKATEGRCDFERANDLEARIWLDGPLGTSQRIKGALRDLFLDMNGVALRSPRLGSEMEPPSAMERLAELSLPTMVICGDLDFPDLQSLCAHLSRVIPGATLHVESNTAHLPNLERPEIVSNLIAEFLRHRHKEGS